MGHSRTAEHSCLGPRQKTISQGVLSYTRSDWVGSSCSYQEQWTLLQKRFPDSPRVQILLGLRLEAEGHLEKARELYDDLLAVDETNVVGPLLVTSLLRPKTQGRNHALTYSLRINASSPSPYSTLPSIKQYPTY